MAKYFVVLLFGACLSCALAAKLDPSSMEDYANQLQAANGILSRLFTAVSRSDENVQDENAANVKRSSSYGGGGGGYGGGSSYGGGGGGGLISGMGSGIGGLIGNILRSLTGIGIKLGLNLNQEFYNVDNGYGSGGYGGGSSGGYGGGSSGGY